MFDPFADRLDPLPPSDGRPPAPAVPSLRDELLGVLPAVEGGVSSEAPWERSDSPSTAR